VAQVEKATGISRHTAEQYMAEMDWVGVSTFEKDGIGKPSHLYLNPEWAWCASEEFAPLLLGHAQAANEEPLPGSAAAQNLANFGGCV